MDQKTLQATKEKVQAAEKIQKQISILDKVIASCNAEIGFMNVTVNYQNQNEIRLVTEFGAKEVFDAYKDAVVEAAKKEKARLEKEFKELQF